MGAAHPEERYSLTEYLEFEERSEIKHEYLAGRIFAMAGASPEHNQICFNLSAIIGRQLQTGKCRGFSSDQKIRVEAADLNTYADVTIVCGEPRYHEDDRRILLNPTVIVEVLSPTTEAWDRGGKWACYQQLETLTDYLLVSQDRAQLEHFSLEAGGSWRYVPAVGLAGNVYIESINCNLALSEVYNGIEFPPINSSRPPIRLSE